MATIYYVAAKFRSAMPDDTQILPIPFPFHPLWNRPGGSKYWSLGKDTTSGIHKDRMARQFKGTKETNRTTTHIRRVSGGGQSVTLLSMPHIVAVNIGHVRNSKPHEVLRLETWV